MSDLSEAEYMALYSLVKSGGSFLISHVPDKNGKDEFGEIEPGIRVYEKLDKKGLVIITEEEPFELESGDEFTFTPMIELTDEGREAFDAYNNSPSI